MKSIVSGYITRGIVVEYPTSSHPFYNDKLKIRVPEVHGISSRTKSSFTQDEDLPYSYVSLVPRNVIDDTRKYVRDLYSLGSIVYVSFPSGDQGDILVTGLCVDGSSSGLTTDLTGSIVSGGGLIQTDDTSNYNSTYRDIFGKPFDTRIVVSSPYGWRASFGSFHYGIDLCTPDLPGHTVDSPVLSVADGTVITAVSSFKPNQYANGSYGNYIVVDHGEINPPGIQGRRKYYSLYAHLNKVYVKVGQKVKGSQGGSQGYVIGLSGNTGHSFGDHLHLEIRVGGNSRDNAKNPANYIKFN